MRPQGSSVSPPARVLYPSRATRNVGFILADTLLPDLALTSSCQAFLYTFSALPLTPSRGEAAPLRSQIVADPFHGRVNNDS